MQKGPIGARAIERRAGDFLKVLNGSRTSIGNYQLNQRQNFMHLNTFGAYESKKKLTN